MPCEDLLVGDDNGRIYYYSIDWPDSEPGSTTLLVKLDAHRQNICGLGWAPDGRCFITGGNDNVALLFKAEDVLAYGLDHDMSGPSRIEARRPQPDSPLTPPLTPHRDVPRSAQLGLDAIESFATLSLDLPATPPASPRRGRAEIRSDLGKQTRRRALRSDAPLLENSLADQMLPGIANLQIYAFYHAAAVKAIAFAPWQPSLVATGGGSNDRQIHFYHTTSGTALAVINVFAQVTSLIWSTTRRELVATFGYAQPDHSIRIAVFSWPECECVTSIPWDRKANGEIGRALWAIPYPGGPNDAIPSRKQIGEGFAAWEAVRIREMQRRRAEAAQEEGTPSQERGRSAVRTPSTTRSRSTPSTMSSPAARRRCERSLARSTGVRAEGEPWASRTEEEGSLIIACCDQTVKFFEVWAGKSTGNALGGKGLGSAPGVLGGSRVLEGWCEGIGELGLGRADAIR
ncbi:Meiosis-specific APC/C activator protein AMA1 [Cyphellophora attinorum]|uniref:Meiosis-specific APC/C activator protein AMA1 n=1 Tax=Cyphellophora attinorum TaxID=1664694 RepID=A0A0N1P0Y3_9EURO|nr:Meiosis-specific APC/C activator protein AMA1 [Phialophora attinorum]KPI40825.1 Meiosis-specific APC/C activator protein AMA1 [Phialophora attinorum]